MPQVIGVEPLLWQRGICMPGARRAKQTASSCDEIYRETGAQAIPRMPYFGLPGLG